MIAAVLAAEGVRVVVHGRDQARTEQTARKVGGEAVIGDLTTDAGAEAVASRTGEVDILVNNAGFYDPATGWADTDAGAWAEMYNINVFSSVRLIRHLVPGMRATAEAAPATGSQGALHMAEMATGVRAATG
ncbi:SDR family NAD(P)-dependent oxidoreductase [Micromonospora sp. NPDC004704]